MNFKEHRIEIKFNPINKNEILYEILKDKISKLIDLENIPYNILFWVKKDNIILFKKIVELENKILELITLYDKKKFNKKINEYVKCLNILIKYYTINKIEADKYLNKFQEETCFSIEKTMEENGLQNN